MEVFLIAASALVFCGILLTPLVAKTGAPLLLLFLGIGMLLGEDGPGQLKFDNFEWAYQVGGIALAVILFSGGLDTNIRDLKRAWSPALSLATLGVCLTTAIVGGLITLFTDHSLATALLLGAVVASTDAAATFMLLNQRAIHLTGRVKETILIESGLNDPFAIFLTVLFVGIVDSGAESLGWSTVVLFVSQIGLGVSFGVAGGLALAWLVNRIELQTGLFPVLVLAGGLLMYSLTAWMGGSGYLAIYLCGILISARSKGPIERIMNFQHAMAWLCQIGLFVMLGLLVTPRTLMADLPAGLGVAAGMMFIARPLSVMACLGPLKFSLREQLFIGWVGLRGAVPIFLAIIPVISPGPVTVRFFNIVFIVVIASLTLQGWTLTFAARKLGVDGSSKTTPPADGPPSEIAHAE